MNFPRFANSIVTRIVLLGIGIILVGTGARYVVLANVLREDLEKVAARQLEALGSYVARDIGHKFSQRQAMLQQMAATLPPSLLEQPARLRVWLGERHRRQPLFSHGFAVVDAGGLVLADYSLSAWHLPGSPGVWDSAGNRPTGEMAVGTSTIGKVDGVPALALGVPIQDRTGRVRATLVGVTALNTPGFLDLFQESRIGDEGGFVLISPGDKAFVSAAGQGLVLQTIPETGANSIHDRVRAGIFETAVATNTQGVEEVSAIAPVPGTDWLVVASLPTAEAFAPVQRARYFVLLMSGVVLAVFLVLAIGGLYAVFRPLLLAADHADRMTRGELPLEPLPVVRADEVGHLTEAFNRLLAKLQSSQAKLAYMAHHDTLTGLPNRVLLADRMKQALARSRRNGSHLAVLYIDLDGFKPINDSLGHDVGDEALVEIARRLATILREADTLARVGGDEFVVVLNDLDPVLDKARAAACTVAAKYIEVLEQPLMLKEVSRSLGLSIGIALGDGRSSPDQLLSAADSAMYLAKQSGRSRYVVAEGTPRPGES